jgi:hypothetical protein
VTPQSGTTNWAPGWQVAVGGTTLRTQSALTNITMTGPTSVSYNGSGRLTPPPLSPIQIQITSDGTGVTPRCITVDPSGRPVTKAQAC